MTEGDGGLRIPKKNIRGNLLSLIIGKYQSVITSLSHVCIYLTITIIPQ
jgi:hypothetical protein